jgi:hypothetical protein
MDDVLAQNECFSKVEEIISPPQQDKIHTIKHNNKEVQVKIPYYLSSFEPYMTAEPKDHNVLFVLGKKVSYSHPSTTPLLHNSTRISILYYIL